MDSALQSKPWGSLLYCTISSTAEPKIISAMGVVSQPDYKNVYYPPGGILLWMIIFLELITFGLGLLVMVFYAKDDPVLFHESKMQLNIAFGTINTIFLLTSGFFMACSVHELRQDNRRKSRSYLLLTMVGGVLFLVLKSIEYAEKIEAGLTIGVNDFFTIYWMITMFHVIHVIVGLIILISIYKGLLNQNSSTKIEDVEAGAAFWHLCDLIWLLIFPVIYLIL